MPAVSIKYRKKFSSPIMDDIPIENHSVSHIRKYASCLKQRPAAVSKGQVRDLRQGVKGIFYEAVLNSLFSVAAPEVPAPSLFRSGLLTGGGFQPTMEPSLIRAR